MLPLQDNIPTRNTPYVNYGMVLACVAVFVLQLQDPPAGPSLVERLGMIPLRVTQPGIELQIPDVQLEEVAPGRYREILILRTAAPSLVPAWLTPLTCIFLHGGWMHLIGNMWFLYIFGDNVEDRFGHLGYLIFYICCGVAASLVHLISDPGSNIPTIGASGAIAGVLGAYFLWYPGAQVKALIPLGPLLRIMVVPAPLFLGFWFLIQLVQGATASVGEGGGVAWWAHVGGFVAGLGGAALVAQLGLVAPLNSLRDPGTMFHSPIHFRRQRSFSRTEWP